MNLHEAKKLTVSLMEDHGLSGWVFEWSNKRRAAGTCHYDDKKVTLSKPITALAEEGDVRKVILHEIAHALTPGEGHSMIWKRKLIEIGGDGERCYSEDSSLYRAHITHANYKAVCPNGHEHFKIRHKAKGRQSCAQCSRKFDERFILNWITI